MNRPEKKNPTERLNVAQKIADTISGERPIDARYPYFPPDYEVPFLHIGTERQLFVDNFILDHLDGVNRIFPTPERPGKPLIEVGDLPWERHHNPIPLGALRDPDTGLFKLWYSQPLSDDPFGDSGNALAYAESDDCLNWRKPLSRDFLPINGHDETNIVLKDSGHHIGLVVNSDQRDPERKYLMVYNPGDRARAEGKNTLSTVVASPDGISWTEISADTPHRHHHFSRVIWDDSIAKWIAYSQYSHHWNFLHRKRQIGRQESTDFINWSPKEVVISVDDDPNLPPNLEFHDMSVRKTGGLYIGIAGEFMAEPLWSERDGRNWRDCAFTHAGLHVSRDGRQWRRVGGLGPWAENGPPGSDDFGFVAFSAAGQLVHEGRIYIPYLATADKQHWFDPQSKDFIYPLESFERAKAEWESLRDTSGKWPKQERSVSAFVLREDGWARLQPTYERGRVITRQFVFEGDQLQVNADTSGGYLRVEILDSTFEPYDGFSLEDCRPVSADDVWHTVRWRSDLRNLWNKPVRLVFHLTQAHLYSFQFAE